MMIMMTMNENNNGNRVQSQLFRDGVYKRIKKSNSDKNLARFAPGSNLFVTPRKKTTLFDPDKPTEIEATWIVYFREIVNQESVSSILKLVFNCLFGALLFYLIYQGINGIRDDVNKKRDNELNLAMLKLEQCAKDYKLHGCDAEHRLPALEGYCLEKERCLNQDPAKDMHASKMTAAIVAQALNEFIEPLGFKTIGVICFFLFGMVIVCNCALSGGRGSSYNPDINRLKSRVKELESTSKKQGYIDWDSKGKY